MESPDGRYSKTHTTRTRSTLKKREIVRDYERN